ncbi:MAG TPA: ABC transporter permease [Candidatus Cryosericum sp.]|nr:ABC transporter permease [Candidatus Cryosericum sp.]
MKAWYIAVKDLVVHTRDRTAFVTLLLVPMVMIIVLGSVFNWNATSFQAHAVVVDLDGSNLSRQLTQQVLASPRVRDVLALTTTTSEAEARTLVEQGKTAAAIIIPKGFGGGAASGAPARIEVLENPESLIQAGVVASIVQAYTTDLQAQRVAISVATSVLEESGAVPPARMGEAVRGVREQADAGQPQDLIAVKTTALEGRKVVPALDYYAVGMSLMYLIFTANTGAWNMLEEKRQRTLARIMTTPTARLTVMAGKSLGTLALTALQFAIIILLTRLLYHVQWSSSLPALLLMAGASVLAAAGLSTMVAALVQSREQEGALGPAVALIYSLLGGSMWPVYVMPAWLDAASRLTFTRWAIDGFSALMLGGGVSSVLRPAGVCLGMAVLFLGVSAVALNRNY